MHLEIDSSGSTVTTIVGPVLTRRVPPRNKRVAYDAKLLPQLDRKKEYAASDIVTGAMKVFAKDAAVVSIDADLASTSGLEAGIAAVDQKRALNVGVAEANMMLIGEAFAALGCNTWVSTFCPFFDWKVLRRIAVGAQERQEAIEAPDGWLSEGHGLDLTFLATAANFETRTNGATHMGNDDSTTFDAVAQLKIIDVSCPQQMLAIMRWIMEGNRGLVYVRVMRTSSAVLYGSDYVFAFATGHRLRSSPADRATIISSGRGVHEALAAAEKCAAAGIPVGRGGYAIDRRGAVAGALQFRPAAGSCRAEQWIHLAEFAEGSLSQSRQSESGRLGQDHHHQHAQERRPAAVHSFRDL